MVSDRQIFVIRQQRIVRAKELAGVGRVLDAGEEVGVIADCARKLEPAIRGAVKEARTQRFDPGALAAIGIENLADAPAQRDARLAAEREQRVERPAGSGLGGARRQAFEQAEFERRGEIEDLIADGDSAAGGAT